MASSILTNASATMALQNLSATQKALNTTQSQISSGLKVAMASDNAAYWSISSTLKSDVGALSAVSDALSLGSSVLDVAAAAVASTITLMNRIRADLVTAQQPGTSLADIQTDIKAQQQSIVATLSSASFNGVNLLDGSPPAGAVTFVTGMARSPSSGTSLATMSLTTNTCFSNGIQIGGTTGLLTNAYLPFGAFGGTPVSPASYGVAGTGTGTGAYQAASFLSLDITHASATDLTGLM